MRKVSVTRPSFPEVVPNRPFPMPAGQRWEVLCGDEAHWRIGVYAPTATRAEEIEELELHDCPEMFLLVSGRMSLLLFENGQLREQPLPLLQPILVTVPHDGFCPDGPRTGSALVAERDSFTTVYRTKAEWLGAR